MRHEDLSIESDRNIPFRCTMTNVTSSLDVQRKRNEHEQAEYERCRVLENPDVKEATIWSWNAQLSYVERPPKSRANLQPSLFVPHRF